MDITEYTQKVIRGGDKGSELLARIFSPTLKNSPYVDVVSQGMNGVVVFRFPESHYVVVHSAAGEFSEDLRKTSQSLVDKLLEQARAIGATPIAFSDIIDARDSDIERLNYIASFLADYSNEKRLVVPNGEFAILGDRVRGEANISGTMISIIPKDKISHGINNIGKNVYAVFDHECKPVNINSDGVGTKTEFRDRSKEYYLGVQDFGAMVLDDAVKLAARSRVVSGVVEHTGLNENQLSQIEYFARELFSSMGVLGIMQRELNPSGWKSYKEGVVAHNIGGASVNIIDEERLAHPLIPLSGDSILAIQGELNPRSNGISDKRVAAIKLRGIDWHTTSEGIHLMKYLNRPSTIFYPLFSELIDKGLVNFVTHMSGGAFNGKLARPLAKHNLLARLDNLFPVDPREMELLKALGNSERDGYGKWPMNNEAFVSAPREYDEEVIKIVKKRGLKALEAGRIYSAINKRTGVEILPQEFYFSGRD